LGFAAAATYKEPQKHHLKIPRSAGNYRYKPAAPTKFRKMDNAERLSQRL
jgi:hypothetical protein